MLFTVLMALLSFVLTKLAGGSDRQALGAAVVGGGAAYLAKENTKWGADLANGVDDFFGVGGKKPDVTPGDNKSDGDTDGTIGEDGKSTPGKGAVTGGANGTGSSGLGGFLKDVWDGPGGAGKAVVGAIGGTVAISTVDKWLPWVVGGVGLWLLMK